RTCAHDLMPQLLLQQCLLYTTTSPSSSSMFFFFNDTATTEIYTLSLHDALPISAGPPRSARSPCGRWNDSSGSVRDRSSPASARDRKSTRLNSSHLVISYAVFCLKKKKKKR